MTTISTPHDGSTLTTKLGGDLVGLIKDLIGGFAGLIGTVGSQPSWSYDLMLDQFGLVKESGESTTTYISRVFNSPIFQPRFKDLASYDLSPEASRIFNSQTSLTYSGTYYFSVSTVQTVSCWFSDQCPDIDIEVIMAPTAALIGDTSGLCDTTGYCFGSNWEPNDGLVPQRSSASPQNGITRYVAPQNWASNSKFSPGIWYNRGAGRDHTQIIGFRFNLLATGDAAAGIYTVISNTIGTIPGSGSLVEGDDPDDSSAVQPAVIIGASLGGVGAAVLAAAGVVTYRRRRRSNSAGSNNTTSAFASSMTRSSRKFSKKQMERGSITLHNNELSAENPSFAPSAIVISPAEHVEDVSDRFAV